MRAGAAALAFLLGALAVAAGLTRPVARADDAILDRFFVLRGVRAPALPLLLVDLDEPTLEYLRNTEKRADMTRDDLARALLKLKATGAKVLAVDFPFNGPSIQPASETAFVRDLPQLKGLVVNAGYSYKTAGGTESEVYLPPAPPYGRYFQAGFATVSPDPDLIVRRMQLSRVIGGERRYSFALTLAAAYAGKTPGELLDGLPPRRFLPGGDDQIRVDYAGPDGTFPRVSLYQVLQNSDFANRTLASGRIALVGSTLAIAKNRLATPFSSPGDEFLSGPELHANAANTILNGGISRAPLALRWGWAALLALVMLALGERLTLRLSFVLAGGLLLAAGAVPYLLFARASLWLGCLPGVLAAAAAFGPTAALVARKVARPAPNLHSVALVVIDMCDSTALSNKYGDAFATRLKDALRETVLGAAREFGMRFYKGTGDGLLLVFPDAPSGLRACRRFLAALAERNARVPDKEAIAVRCALHVGEVNLVAVGRHADIEGDAANFVCRIEGLKAAALIEDEGGLAPRDLPAKNRILMSEAAHEDIQDRPEFASRYVGFFDLKGIRGRHRIFLSVAPEKT